MRVVAGVDQLRVYPHFPTRALDAAFEQMRYAELCPDLAQIACNSGFVLHHRSAADHFKVSNPGEVRENFILYPVCKKCVRFVFAQVLKRQHRDAFLRDI